MSTTDDEVRARRVRIEEELERRLRAPIPPRAEAPAPALPHGLRCLGCGRLNPADARFCQECGVRFNVELVAPGGDR
ncbi:MAG: zinc ribbon domain-containing protein [Vicinamibacterales bacterium]